MNDVMIATISGAAPWATAADNVRAVAHGGGILHTLGRDLAVVRTYGLQCHFAWREAVAKAEARLRFFEAEIARIRDANARAFRAEPTLARGKRAVVIGRSTSLEYRLRRESRIAERSHRDRMNAPKGNGGGQKNQK